MIAKKTQLNYTVNMNSTSPSELKSILHSKRANLFYLEHCRVLVKDGRVEYVTTLGKKSLYWNIPIANTTNILLGSGTSVTQAAMRELAKAGVLVGFCGGGGTPLFNSNEAYCDINWFLPQSEYRPTEYMQRWISLWSDEKKRFLVGKEFQRLRLERVKSLWSKTKLFADNGFTFDPIELDDRLNNSLKNIENCSTQVELLTEEARLTKHLYRIAVDAVAYGNFVRAKRGTGMDPANSFLDHGNYLAYGLGATATWVLGIPHGLAVLHGKTRRGGLVFDVADLVKDSTILPQAFLSAMQGDSRREFRQSCIENLLQTKALDFMIDTIKSVSMKYGIA
ncbi:type I-F CRISPR-associated endonuclease Cas1f [Maridesulfovibrio hydrothermalis]|uniref:CRISPR-associated endonuclease Cas1 n=1 Tax=Maridesulfovibrio hydrothermalis AM13 = DSM 14728 TaxID=1121451 RepID=L0RE20_9BACT|nr:type I-F CRISPR-associated endonuclease Cas1f [Maridesulfovibrio hydrothermalis]CCO24447.1 conserved protein of unknown function [Maridesulfovibrio hydrothermalis AM13 = DSM 14728]